MRIPLSAWRPDMNVLGSPYLADVRNALYGPDGWRSQRGLAIAIEPEVPSPVQGMWAVKRSDGDLELFVAGNGFIYRVPNRSDPLQDVSADSWSTGYDDNALVRWRGQQYGDLHLATNFSEPIQAYDAKLGGGYIDLSGEAPRARYITVVRDFPVVGWTHDDVDGDDGFQVRWPGFVDGLPDPTEWTISAETQADFQRLADVGEIVGLTGGEFGTIVCQSGIVRFGYGGGSLFEFATVERAIGSRIPNSVNQYGQSTAFWSPKGWMSFDGSSLRPIGIHKIDDWFRRDFDEDAQHLMWAGSDESSHTMWWLYPGVGHAAGQANRLLRYSPSVDEWMVQEVEAECIAGGRTFGLHLDDETVFANLDEMEVNLDDPSLWSALPQTLAIADGRICAFTGATQDALFLLPERELVTGKRSLIREIVPIGEGGATTVAVGKRDRFDRDMAWSREHGLQADGVIRPAEAARSHAFRATRTGDWNRALALDVEGTELGRV